MDKPLPRTKNLGRFLGADLTESSSAIVSPAQAHCHFVESPIRSSTSISNPSSTFVRGRTSPSKSPVSKVDLDLIAALESMPSSRSSQGLFGDDQLVDLLGPRITMSRSSELDIARADNEDLTITAVDATASPGMEQTWSAAVQDDLHRDLLVRAAPSLALKQKRPSLSSSYHSSLNEVIRTITVQDDGDYDDDELDLEAVLAGYCSTDEGTYSALSSPAFTPDSSACSTPTDSMHPSIVITADDSSCPPTPKEMDSDLQGYFMQFDDCAPSDNLEAGFGEILDLFPSLPSSPILPHENNPPRILKDMFRPANPVLVRDEFALFDEADSSGEWDVQLTQTILRDTGFLIASSRAGDATRRRRY
jgi:hypothetical protein